MARRYRQEAEQRWGNDPTVEVRQASGLIKEVMFAMAALVVAAELEAAGEDPETLHCLRQDVYDKLSSLSEEDMNYLFKSAQPGGKYSALYADIESRVRASLSGGFAKKLVFLGVTASMALGPDQFAAADTLPDPNDNVSTVSTSLQTNNRQNTNGNVQPDPRISDEDNNPYKHQLTQQPNAQQTAQPVVQPATGQFETENPQWSAVTPDISEVNDAIKQAAQQAAEALRAGKKDNSLRKSVESELGSIAGLLVTEQAREADPVVNETREENDSPETAPALSAYKPLLKLIGQFESGNSYNAYFKDRELGRLPNVNFSRMTVGQVMEWQRDYKARGSRSTAVGYYQFLLGTLDGLVDQMDISLDSRFNAETQDNLALQLLKRRGLNKYLRGEMSDEEFAHSLSKEWASLPSVLGDNPNASYYDGDGLNKAHVSVRTVLNAVKAIKSHKKTVAPNPSANDDNQNQEPDIVDPEWIFPPETEAADPFPITTEQKPDESGIADLLGRTWEGVADWLGQDETDEVNDPEILDTPMIFPQESANDGKIKGFLKKMFGDSNTPEQQSPAGRLTTKYPDRITSKALKLIQKDADLATQQARLALVEKALEFSDDVKPEVPRYKRVKPDKDLVEALMATGYTYDQAIDCGMTLAALYIDAGVDTGFNRGGVKQDAKRNHMNTTTLHKWALQHAENGVTNLGGNTKYQIIRNPSKKDLLPGDLVLAPGHIMMWTGPVKHPNGKTYYMAEAALGSERVFSLRDGVDEWNYIKYDRRGTIILRVIASDNADQY